VKNRLTPTLLAVSLIWLSLSTATASTVVYNFDNGGISATLPISGSTGFTYTQSGLTATFAAVTNMMDVNTAQPSGTPATFTGDNLNATTASAVDFTITFSQLLNYVNLDYFMDNNHSFLGINNTGNSINISFYDGATWVYSLTYTNSGFFGSQLSANVTEGAIASVTNFFDKIKITTSNTSILDAVGTLYVDNITVNTVSDVPEIDPTASFSALSLLGTAFFMIKGCRRRIS